jgi:hypothetical protein
VHIGGWSNFFHIKDLFYSFLLFLSFLLLFYLNFSSPAAAATTTRNALASASRRRHISLPLFIIRAGGVM